MTGKGHRHDRTRTRHDEDKDRTKTEEGQGKDRTRTREDRDRTGTGQGQEKDGIRTVERPAMTFHNKHITLRAFTIQTGLIINRNVLKHVAGRHANTLCFSLLHPQESRRRTKTEQEQRQGQEQERTRTGHGQDMTGQGRDKDKNKISAGARQDNNMPRTRQWSVKIYTTSFQISLQAQKLHRFSELDIGSA